MPDICKYGKARRRSDGPNGREERTDESGHRLITGRPTDRIGVAVVAEAEVQRKARGNFPVVLNVWGDRDFPKVSGRVVQGWNRRNSKRIQGRTLEPVLTIVVRAPWEVGVGKKEAPVRVGGLKVLSLYSGDDNTDLQAMSAMSPSDVIGATELILNDLVRPIRVRAHGIDDQLEAALLAVLARQFAGLGTHEVQRIRSDRRTTESGREGGCLRHLGGREGGLSSGVLIHPNETEVNRVHQRRGSNMPFRDCEELISRVIGLWEDLVRIARVADICVIKGEASKHRIVLAQSVVDSAHVVVLVVGQRRLAGGLVISSQIAAYREAISR